MALGLKLTIGNDKLVEAMDKLAEKMLTNAEAAGITNQVDVFSAVVKWIAVKNRLNLSDDDGSKINAYRDALADTPTEGALHRTYGSKHARDQFFRKRENVASAHTLKKSKRVPNGGNSLEEFKSRLPDANGGNNLSDGNDAFRPLSPPNRGSGGVPSGVDGDGEPGQPETDGKPDL